MSAFRTSRVVTVVTAAAFALAMVGSAEAAPRKRYRSNNGGNAAAAVIGGLAIAAIAGAAIASQNKPRYDDRYYAPAYQPQHGYGYQQQPSYGYQQPRAAYYQDQGYYQQPQPTYYPGGYGYQQQVFGGPPHHGRHHYGRRGARPEGNN